MNLLLHTLPVPFVLIMLCSACLKKDVTDSVHNLNNNTVSVFGHGGMGIAFKYPINSYESFEPCLRIGADGTEMDVQMTKDSLLILFHDQKLKDGTLCSGIVNEKNWSEIKNCLHACPYSNSVDMIPVSYLFDKTDLSAITITFDCKLYKAENTDYQQFLTTYANALIKLTEKYGIGASAFVESGDTNFLRLLKNRAPAMKLFMNTSRFEEGLLVADNLDLYGITTDLDNISGSQVKIAHRHNRQITVWNVQSERENIDAVKKNVDHIQSDKIIPLLKLFGKYKRQGAKNLRW